MYPLAQSTDHVFPHESVKHPAQAAHPVKGMYATCKHASLPPAVPTHLTVASLSACLRPIAQSSPEIDDEVCMYRVADSPACTSTSKAASGVLDEAGGHKEGEDIAPTGLQSPSPLMCSPLSDQQIPQILHQRAVQIEAHVPDALIASSQHHSSESPHHACLSLKGLAADA